MIASLDGYVEDAEGRIDWVEPDHESREIPVGGPRPGRQGAAGATRPS